MAPDTVGGVRSFIPSRRPWSAAVGAAALSAALVVTACGSSQLETEPTFDGTWLISRLEVGGDPVALTTAAGADDALTIEIDTGDAAVRARTGCGPAFGSYTLVVDDEASEGPGLASFTIPSPAPGEECDEPDRLRHDAMVSGLETVNRWRRDGSSLLLEGPDGTSLELRPLG